MSFNLFSRARRAAPIALALSLGSVSAHAEIKNYEFRLVSQDIKTSDNVIAVRLIRKSDSKAVPDAVIFATRLDMQPDGMEAMKTSIEPQPSAEPGIYRFKVKLTMEGNWRLSLGAKIQGEADTLENRLVFKVLP